MGASIFRCAVLALALLCWVPRPGGAAQGDAETRAVMGEILEALLLVLPASRSDARYKDPAERERVLRALRALAASGARLEAHGADLDASFGFLSGSLARDTAEILERFEDERYAESRFLLHQVTDDCVACHSRLPDAAQHPLGARLFEDPTVSGLPPLERVELEMATRQFDRALKTYEGLFASPDVSPMDLDLLGALDAYLELCLRVRQEPERAAQGFRKLATRKDVSPPLASTLRSWIEALDELTAGPPAPPTLDAGRTLVERARDRARFPDDRRSVVLYVAASGVLHRYVSDAKPAPAQLGEAYYWLGVIESHVGRSFWLSQTEHFLEAAIRTAPAEPTAEEAFALLEEFVISGYTGSAGTSVPPEVQARLAELRSLIDAQRPPQVGSAASR